MNMKQFGVPLALSLILSLSGCYVQSLYPCYSKEAAVDMPELVGNWREADDAEQKKPAWQFKDDGTIITYEDDVSSPVKAVYFRVGEHVFADWTAGDIDEDTGINSYWSVHVMPTHSVLKVEHHGDELTLTPLDLGWTTEAAKEDPSLLPHVLMEEDDHLLFMAFPEEWETFLQAHATNSAAFNPDSALRFLKVPAVEETSAPADPKD